MNTILIVTSSANGEASVSSRLADELRRPARATRDPGVEIVLRDVGANPVPHLTAGTVAAIKGQPESEAELRRARAVRRAGRRARRRPT